MRRALAVAVSALVWVLAGCADDPASPNAAQATSTSMAAATATESDATESGPPHLVNLGDSFSAAAGVQPLVAGSPVVCLRSSRNFAHVLAAAEGYRLTDVSCSGADTEDFESAQYDGVPPQLDALTPDADIVTVMIGGNDNDLYSTAIRECADLAAGDLAGSPCRDARGTHYIDIVEEQTAPALVAAMAAVREKSPDAEVLVVGYPWILPPTGGCYPTMPVASGDVPYLRELQSVLNAAGQQAAEQAGARFVDMAQPSEGHDACAPVGQRWIEPRNGASGAAPIHPNVAGQQAIADEVAAALQ
ncbi:MAG: SGNH/GDSL hydrolase family protein [Actinomycetota bacterium]|nr:SGNH/GDSL hydrolase family protein [Actinomycetota bacterium]